MARRFDLMLAVGLVLFVGGIVRDGAWHATHDTQKEFETASTQIAVHWLLWLGALVLLAVSALGLRGFAFANRSRALALTCGSGVVYALVSIWHFIEHANGNDPQLAHAFLYAAATGLVLGAVLALVGGARMARLGPGSPRP